MAMTINVEHTRGNLFSFRPKDILFPEFTGREGPPTREKIDEMKVSLLEHGQLQPIDVRLDENKKPVLIFGAHRTMAMFELAEEFPDREDLQFIKAQVMRVDEEKALEMQCVENMMRAILTPLDEARIVQEWRVKFGKKDSQIAKILNVSQPWVSQRNHVLTMPKEIQDKMRDGTLSLLAAMEMLNIDPEHRKEVLEEAVAKNNGSAKKKGKATANSIKKAGKTVAERKGKEDVKNKNKPSSDKPNKPGIKDIRTALKTIIDNPDVDDMVHRTADLIHEFMEGKYSEERLVKKLIKASAE